MTTFEEALAQTLDRKLTHPHALVPPNLAESIRYSLLGPGKRIRPRLLLHCAEMVGLPHAAALPAAMALEMVHCFTLIHDDLPSMDNDDFRRGRPSNHKKFGEAIALLAGDGLLAMAYDVFRESAGEVAPERFLRAFEVLLWASGPAGVIGGQAAEALLTPSSPLEALEAMHALKTGALFQASLLIPRDLAGVAPDSNEGLAIEAFAKELGFAFQVADDFADAEQDVGKPTNILFYLSRETAESMTIQRLDAAQKALRSAWGEASRPLLLIAEEVLRTLRRPSENGSSPR